MDSDFASKNHYELLSVARDADTGTIRAAWKREIRHWHPDRWIGRARHELEAAQQRARAINEALRVLSDEGERQSYDIELRMADLESGRQRSNHRSSEYDTAEDSTAEEEADSEPVMVSFLAALDDTSDIMAEATLLSELKDATGFGTDLHQFRSTGIEDALLTACWLLDITKVPNFFGNPLLSSEVWYTAAMLVGEQLSKMKSVHAIFAEPMPAGWDDLKSSVTNILGRGFILAPGEWEPPKDPKVERTMKNLHWRTRKLHSSARVDAFVRDLHARRAEAARQQRQYSTSASSRAYVPYTPPGRGSWAQNGIPPWVWRWTVRLLILGAIAGVRLLIYYSG